MKRSEVVGRSRSWVRAIVALTFALVTVGVGTRATAATSERSYVIAVGYNGLPSESAEGDEALSALRFSDDDAVAVYELFRAVADEGALLTSFDADTRRRYPELSGVAREPTLSELRRAVARIRQRIDADLRQGVLPTVVFFYSGHGISNEMGPALTLPDQAISSSLLYTEVIEPLSAARLHLIVDACHAEGVVRPRDVRAAVVNVSADDLNTYVHRTTLQRYPDVGAIIATTRSAQSHEWDLYGAGVFTHELLSGLRGGADVDGNGLIEYGELAAFLSAANRNVVDPRGKLNAVIRAPNASARTPLIDLRRMAASARLRGRVSRLGAFHVEDDRGVRLLDVHAERGFIVTLVVPANRTLFVRSRDVESEFRLSPGQVVSLDTAEFRAPSFVARGALESAFRRGLFATGFGPGYYLGYTDRDPNDAPDPKVFPEAEAPPRRTSWRAPATWLSFGASGALAIGALASGTAALSSYRDVGRAEFEADALAARDRYRFRRDLALATGAGALLTGVVGIVLWRASREEEVRLSIGVNNLGFTGRL